jgi:hypothetical protein
VILKPVPLTTRTDMYSEARNVAFVGFMQVSHWETNTQKPKTCNHHILSFVLLNCSAKEDQERVVSMKLITSCRIK